MLPNSQFDQELITSSERELILVPKKKRTSDEKEMTQTAGVIPKFWLHQQIRKILKTNSEKIDEVVRPEK